MPCPLCGDICRCSSEEGSVASSRCLPQIDVRSDAVTPQSSWEIEGQRRPNPQLTAETAMPGCDDKAEPDDSAAWRQEVAARLNRYQSRRKPRPPRYPSLRLCFETEDPTVTANGVPREDPGINQIMPTVSNQALAFDRFAEDCAAVPEPLASPLLSAPQNIHPAEAMPLETAPARAKIIEFPRSWTPPPAPLDELAEPVITRPRILEAPEVVPPPPALGGITIEPAQTREMEKRPGIDIPLQGAPLARRMLSALVDDVIIIAACALFGFIFWKLTAIRPPRLQMIGWFAGLAGLLWATYQYLLVVYAGATLGLRVAGLELTRFDGSPARRRLRRWRVLASYLSAISLGMGYGWVFLDEDSLCWHDRITHTYIARKK